jgi:hypothetical protein
MMNSLKGQRNSIANRIIDLSEMMDKEEEPNVRDYYRVVIKQLQTRLEKI